jgi:type II secretory pathway pseudopilin PulG
MRLSRKVWIILGIGIIAVLLGIVFSVYSQQVREQQELNERLDTARVLSTRLEADEEDLENELAQAQSLLNRSQAEFPQAIESIEYGEYLFEIADRSDLTLASLSFPQPSAMTAGAVTYSVVPLSLPVSGALADIFKFIDIIKTDARFASTEVKSVNLNVIGGDATISVVIYGYKR